METITDLNVKDVRFPTSLNHDGSDAIHTDPDYSCAYVEIRTSAGHSGYGMTFTLGKGNEVVVAGIEALKEIVIGESVNSVFKDFSGLWKRVTNHSQLRWIGPEKGVTHLATAAIINALWDLWARLEGKPLWKLLCDLTPDQLVSTIDFRYLTDVITREEALKMLKAEEPFKSQRENEIVKKGYPAYTTQVGWLGYSDEKIQRLCREYLSKGFTAFKIKVGQDLERDKARCRMVRQCIGWDNTLMVDSNQIWEVQQAIDWMKELAEFKPLWIEEPTSPDDILGHLEISKALKPYGIHIATGEMVANRVMFKQFLKLGAMDYCQIDSARIGGVNEILSVYLMAKKLNIKVCPHAGGVGLCEMVQHLQYFDYICLNGTSDGKWIEYVDQQHEHFISPAVVLNAAYMAPKDPGYSVQMKEETIQKYQYPNGSVWKELKRSN